VVTLEAAFSSDDIAWALYLTLRDTGARVSEVSGLRVKDCDLGQQCLHLTATPWRSLKTNNSERSVPLSHTSATALAKLAQGKDPEAPLFPNYAKDCKTQTNHVYDLHSPCSCWGCTSASPAVAAEDPLEDVSWHPSGPGRCPCGACWLAEHPAALPLSNLTQSHPGPAVA
jgi:hypothetical protein